jgi:hypothetical protein
MSDKRIETRTGQRVWVILGGDWEPNDVATLFLTQPSDDEGENVIKEHLDAKNCRLLGEALLYCAKRLGSDAVAVQKEEGFT